MTPPLFAAYRVTVKRIAALLAPWIVVASLGNAAGATTVIGDDDADRFVGSGSLILPGSSDSHTRSEAANCPDCLWRFQDPCPMRDPDEPLLCSFTPMPCAADETHLHLVFSPDRGASWQGRGLYCIGPAGPLTVAAVDSRVREEVERLVPPIRIRHQPARGVLPRLPLILDSGQSALEPITMRVLGADIAITPNVRWEWRFSDGASLRTDIPGSRHPDRRVSHTFRRGGQHSVTCTATWSAQFTVDDLGPFPVEQPIEQSSTLRVTVAEARAHLVAPQRN